MNEHEGQPVDEMTSSALAAQLRSHASDVRKVLGGMPYDQESETNVLAMTVNGLAILADGVESGTIVIIP